MSNAIYCVNCAKRSPELTNKDDIPDGWRKINLGTFTIDQGVLIEQARYAYVCSDSCTAVTEKANDERRSALWPLASSYFCVYQDGGNE